MVESMDSIVVHGFLPCINTMFEFKSANESAPLLMFDPPIFHPKVELESGIADLGFSSWRSPVS